MVLYEIQKIRKIFVTPLYIVTVIIIIGLHLLYPVITLGDTEDTLSRNSPKGEFHEIFHEVSDLFELKISIIPNPPVTGTLKLAFIILNSKTGKPVTDAVVRVFANPEETGHRQYSPGLNAAHDKKTYYSQLELHSSGLWRLEVEISSSLGQTVFTDDLEISTRSRNSNGPAGTALFILTISAFLSGGIWIWWSARKTQKRRALRRNTNS